MKVMISSTLGKMSEYRSQLDKDLRAAGFQTMLCEVSRPPNSDPVAFSRQLVSDCDVYLLVIGTRYGTKPLNLPDEMRSYTEIEYDEASASGKPMFVFALDQAVAFKQFRDEAHDANELERAVAEFRQREDFIYRLKTRKTVIRVIVPFETEHELSKLALLALQGATPQPFRRPLLPVHQYDLLQIKLCGRAGVLEDLDRWIDEAEANVPICVVEALGGMGKSALAWTWWQSRYNSERAFAGAFWYSFYEDTANYRDLMLRLASYIAGSDLSNSEIHDWEKVCHDGLRNEKLLIVLDGFEATFQGYSHTRRSFDEKAFEALEAGTDAYRKREELVNFRKIADGELAQFIKSLHKPNVVSSRFLITTRYLPFDLQQGAGAPIAAVRDLPLNSFTIEETRDYWKRRGLNAADSKLSDLHTAVEGWPLALQVASGSMSKGESIAAFYRRGAFDPFREGATRAEKRSDVFAAALNELDQLCDWVLRAISALRFPIPVSILYGLLETTFFRYDVITRDLEERGIEYDDFSPSPVVRDAIEQHLHEAILRLTERQLVGFDKDRLTIHPVLSHAVRSRAKSMLDIISGASSIGVPDMPKSVVELEINIALVALMLEHGMKTEAVYLAGDLRNGLRRLNATRELFEIYKLFVAIDEEDNGADPTFLITPEDIPSTPFDGLAAQSDFAQGLASLYEISGRPDLSIKLQKCHSGVHLCLDPMCAMSSEDSLIAVGRLTEAEEVVFRCVTAAQQAISARDDLDEAKHRLKREMTLDNMGALMVQYRSKDYKPTLHSLKRMYSAMASRNAAAGYLISAATYTLRAHELVAKSGWQSFGNMYDSSEDYLIDYNLDVAAIYRYAERYARAKAVVAECLERAEVIGSNKRLTTALLEQAECDAAIGNELNSPAAFKVAIDAIEHALEFNPGRRGTAWEAKQLLKIADFRSRLGDSAVAEHYLALARDASPASIDRQVEAGALFAEAQMRRRAGSTAQEKDLLVQALNAYLADTEEAAPLILHGQRQAAARLRELGNNDGPAAAALRRVRPAKVFPTPLGSLREVAIAVTRDPTKFLLPTWSERRPH